MMMEKAFWDLLREDLDSDEPSYEHALSLLAEIREVCFERLSHLVLNIGKVTFSVTFGEFAQN